ncbi:hypothetical protein AAG906_033617 [Vitis piasezkii]
MKYVWIEESPNTASDCGVAPPKKGDGLRSRRGTTRKVEEHFPRHVQGLEWRKSSESTERLRRWRRRRESENASRAVREMQPPAGKWRVAGAWMLFWCRCLHKSWRSPPGAPSGMFAGGEWFLTTIRLTGKYWEMGKVTGKKHGHRKNEEPSYHVLKSFSLVISSCCKNKLLSTKLILKVAPCIFIYSNRFWVMAGIAISCGV